jgi:hypothetical protein
LHVLLRLLGTIPNDTLFSLILLVLVLAFAFAFALKSMCCSLGKQRMDNYQGDLTDIVRASGGPYGSSDWQFPSDPMIFSSSPMEEPRDNFGDPFSNMRDPLLNELHLSGSTFFGTSNSADIIGTSSSVDDTSGFSVGSVGVGVGVGSSTSSCASTNILDDEMKRPSCNIFSRMLQISPNAKLPVSPCDSPVMAANSPRGIKASAMLPSDMISANNSISISKPCFIDNTGVQISSPRNPGIKRR